MALFLLSALVGVAALAVAVRARFASRAETLLATMLVANFLVVLPIYVLGLNDLLFRGSLAAASVLCATITLAAAATGTGWRSLAAQMRAAVVAIAKIPVDAIRRSWGAGSLVAGGLLLTFAFLAWTTVVAWLAPPRPLWDSAWYHEPTVGFTIQNHGFAILDVPDSLNGLQKTNGYPRLAEMTQLWFVLFGDRRFVELPNILMTIPLMLSVYLIASRYSADRIVCMGWGAALVLTPACSSLLQSAYNDPQVAALVMAALHFATRIDFKLRHAWLAAVALALAVGAKLLALVPVGILSAIAGVRLLLVHEERRTRGWLATILGGAALITAAGACCYLRNWIHFHNPFWPDLKYDNHRLGIHWPGYMVWGSHHPELSGNRVDQNVPLDVLIGELFSLPYSVKDLNRWQVHDYGIGLPWLVLPLSSAALGLAIVEWVRSDPTRALARVSPSVRSPASNILLVALPLVFIVATSPALWGARYHIATVGILMILVQWLAGHYGWAKLGEGAVVVCLVTSLMMIVWSDWWITPRKALALAKLSYPEREVASSLGAPVATWIGLAREAELLPGDVVVASDYAFPALLWNLHYSNRVVYLPAGADFRQRAEQARAVWIVCAGALCDQLNEPASDWEPLGPIAEGDATVVYHRKARDVRR
jgi:hypothetical protein